MSGIIEPTTVNERDTKTGRFVSGNSGGPGRKVGSRSRSSEAFVQDLASIWEEKGIEVLERCARDEPGTFLRVCASLMPKDINLSVGFDAQTTLTAFRDAVRLLGNAEPKSLPKAKVIDAARS